MLLLCLYYTCLNNKKHRSLQKMDVYLIASFVLDLQMFRRKDFKLMSPIPCTLSTDKINNKKNLSISLFLPV